MKTWKRNSRSALIARCWKAALPAACVALSPLSGPALAQTATYSADPRVAPGMAPLDVLLVKDAILENWAEYTLLFDGDGVADRRALWADATFTDDLKWRWYDADGKLMMQADSREEMRKFPQPALTASFRHIPIAVRYDDITPTTAKTRTIVAFVDVPWAKSKDKADGVEGVGVPGVPRVGMALYHDTWRKVDGKWLKATSTLYSANKGFWPGNTPVPKPTVSPPPLNSRTWARPTIVANGMSPLDVLVVKNEIRERWADYTFVIDGDGVGQYGGEWSQLSFAPDLRWLWFDPEGTLIRNLDSMEEMRQRHGATNTKQVQGSAKHIPLSIKFDDITPGRVKTRTVVMYLGVPKSKTPGQADGVPGLGVSGVPQLGMAVYHTEWRKEHGRWMMSESFLYGSQKGFWGSSYPAP